MSREGLDSRLRKALDAFDNNLERALRSPEEYALLGASVLVVLEVGAAAEKETPEEDLPSLRKEVEDAMRRYYRLLSSVHEAGHAVLAELLGLGVTRLNVENAAPAVNVANRALRSKDDARRVAAVAAAGFEATRFLLLPGLNDEILKQELAGDFKVASEALAAFPVETDELMHSTLASQDLLSFGRHVVHGVAVALYNRGSLDREFFLRVFLAHWRSTEEKDEADRRASRV